jgi:hypothetical protein
MQRAEPVVKTVAGTNDGARPTGNEAHKNPRMILILNV